MTSYRKPSGRPPAKRPLPLTEPIVLRREFAQVQVVEFIEGQAPLLQWGAVGEGLLDEAFRDSHFW